MVMMRKLGYLGEAESNLVRFAGRKLFQSQKRTKLSFSKASLEQDFGSP
jgi:hypothetical protein